MKQERKTVISGPHILKFKIEDIPNIYFTSDLHFNHANIIKYSNRPFKDVEEMNTTLLTNINNETETNPDAILINCGDVVFSNVSTYDDLMDNIKAKKIYNIIGNHDLKNVLQRRNMLPYDENAKVYWSADIIIQLFNENHKLITTFTVSHAPKCDGQFLGSFNIHGHLHTPKNLDNYTGADINIARKLREKGMCYDVGVDGNNYKPVRLYDILTGNTPDYKLKVLDFDVWKKRLEKF